MIQVSDKINRKAIAATLGLDKSTLTKIVSSLLQIGIVTENHASLLDDKPNVGRKPIYLDLNPDYGIIAGMEIDSDHCACCLIDLHGNVLAQYRGDADVSGQEIIQAATDLYQRLLSMAPATHARVPILGVGIALPGIIDPEQGNVIFSHPLAITQKTNIADAITERLKVPVLIENNANCGCWGELYTRKDKGDKDLVFLFVDNRKRSIAGLAPSGIAIGMGIAVDGRVRYGKNYLAGVFRSALLAPGDASQFHSQDRDAELIELGANIAVIVNTLAPEHVIVYGEMSDPASLTVLRDEIVKRWPFPVEIPCEILASRLPNPGLAYGAAAMFMETLFSMPRIPKVGETLAEVYRGKDLLSLY